MSIDESEIAIRANQIKRYKFSIDFGLPEVSSLVMDEDPPLGRNQGPDPSRLLVAAVAHCMASSLLFCLEKSGIEPEGINARATAQFGRNEDNRLRIVNIDLDIDLKTPADKKGNVDRCKAIFEKYCTVSQSVQKGIPINFSLNIK